MATVLIVCPDCSGLGYSETLVNLTYDGDQTWITKRCRLCDGLGTIEVQEEDDD